MSKLVQVAKYLLAGVTIFCVSWIACVSEWHGRAGGGRAPPTMRTIVAYSESKRAAMDRPSPVTCDRVPAFPTVPHLNRTWTPESRPAGWQRVAGTGVQLYSAHYDGRQPQHYVRILASFPGHYYPAEDQLFCQTRQSNRGNSYDPNEAYVEVVAAKPQEIWYEKWNPATDQVETPLLLSCPLTEPLYGPSIVSVVTETCEDPNNAFLVKPTKNEGYERKFTICVKDLNFENDISRNLIEWIETNRILGVDKIDVYVDKTRKETEDILEYYRSTSLVRLLYVPISHSPERDLWQRRRDHIITYNDCLYRNIHESEYVIPLDIDEVVLPKKANTLEELTIRLIENGWNTSQNSAAIVQNVFFFDFMQNDQQPIKETNNSEVYIKRDDVRLEVLTNNINFSDEVIDNKYDELSELYRLRCGTELKPKLLQHTTRSALVSPKGAFSKSLMVTKHVLMAFNHYPLASVGSPTPAPSEYWFAPFEEVQLNHYKESCNSTLVEECAQYEHASVRDDSALRLRGRLAQALASAPCPCVEGIY